MKLVAEDPLISDQRVARIEGLLRRFHPDFPDKGMLFTYVQPPDKETARKRVAVFAVKSPDPKGRGMDVITTGSMWFDRWTQLTWAHERLVGIPDPAIDAFRQVVVQHIDKVKRIGANN